MPLTPAFYQAQVQEKAQMAAKICEVSGLRDKRFVFRDREVAGKVLSDAD
ncbi:MAG: hypothetical protein JRI48_10355, partial [Deltaproteobacteria bacterium]|nr:hypothetical protein [Deltaproteobacteria bacterium]